MIMVFNIHCYIPIYTEMDLQMTFKVFIEYFL